MTDNARTKAKINGTVFHCELRVDDEIVDHEQGISSTTLDGTSYHDALQYAKRHAREIMDLAYIQYSGKYIRVAVVSNIFGIEFYVLRRHPQGKWYD